jgi:DNA-binding CsgD family transcriptional regulator
MKKTIPKGPVKVAEKRAIRRTQKVSALALNASKVIVLERRFSVMNLRAKGYSLSEISTELGISPQTASQDIIAVMEDTVMATNEQVEHVRKLQDMRLDMIVKSHLPFATEAHKEVVQTAMGQKVVVERPPSTASAQIVLQTEQRRGKLLGLDVPEVKRMEISGIREYIGVSLEDI